MLLRYRLNQKYRLKQCSGEWFTSCESDWVYCASLDDSSWAGREFTTFSFLRNSTEFQEDQEPLCAQCKVTVWFSFYPDSLFYVNFSFCHSYWPGGPIAKAHAIRAQIGYSKGTVWAQCSLCYDQPTSSHWATLNWRFCGGWVHI